MKTKDKPINKSLIAQRVGINLALVAAFTVVIVAMWMTADSGSDPACLIGTAFVVMFHTLMAVSLNNPSKWQETPCKKPCRRHTRCHHRPATVG